MPRAAPGQNLSFVQSHYRFIDIALRSELHDPHQLPIASHHICTEGVGRAIVPRKVLQVLPRRRVGKILNNNSEAAIVGGEPTRRAPVSGRSRSVPGRASVARRAPVARGAPASSSPRFSFSACRFDADPPASETGPVHVLDNIVCVSRIVEN